MALRNDQFALRHDQFAPRLDRLVPKNARLPLANGAVGDADYATRSSWDSGYPAAASCCPAAVAPPTPNRYAWGAASATVPCQFFADTCTTIDILARQGGSVLRFWFLAVAVAAIAVGCEDSAAVDDATLPETGVGEPDSSSRFEHEDSIGLQRGRLKRCNTSPVSGGDVERNA